MKQRIDACAAGIRRALSAAEDARERVRQLARERDALAIQVTELKRRLDSLGPAGIDPAPSRDEGGSLPCFLAAISHDLCQSAMAAGLFIDLLRRHPLEPKERRLADMAAMSVQDLRGVLEGLVAVSRLEAGLAEPRIGPVSVADLLERLSAEFDEQARLAGVRLQVPPVAATAWTDPMLIELILRNLIGNAVRQAQGRCVRLGCRAEPGTVRLDLTVTGRVPPVGGAGCSEPVPGCAWGWAIVARLCQALGAKAEYRAEPAGSAVFSLHLPAGGDADPGEARPGQSS